MKYAFLSISLLSLLVSTLMLSQVQAQSSAGAVPSTESMIEQLSIKPVGAPKTRGLAGVRNLGVDKANEQEVAATRASLSLQIQFDFNSASILPASEQALANLAAALQSSALASAKFAIEGHTDAKGGADYNQRLSERRANAVRELLMSKGISGTRLAASGKGASDPANKDDPLAAENRRVKIVNLE